ncbi:MAG: sensor histidine kinase [Nakamurella sp.]
MGYRADPAPAAEAILGVSTLAVSAPLTVNPAPGARRIADVPVLLQIGMHLLIAGLLVLAVVHAALSGTTSVVAVTITAVVLAIGYAAGPAIAAVRTSVTGAAIWLAVVLACWLVLLSLSADAIWLAFPWFFLLLHLLPWRWGLWTVALTTVAAIGGFAWHQGTLNAGTAIGPVLGALVAIATVWGYSSIAAENDQRRVLIAELRRAQTDLAAVERSAGALAERERLAREIHDTIAQGLSSIQLLLRAAARALPEGAPAHTDAVKEARLRIEQARQTAQDNLAEARRFVAALAPPGLQGRSLPAALERLCRSTAERSGLDIRFTVQPETAGGQPSAALPTPMEVALLRIAQSAVANVVTHAHAARVTLTLTLMDHAVTLDIVDDGTGFDSMARLPDVGDSGDSGDSGDFGGFGLVAMRFRVAELGGTLTVESAPGQGTAIAASFPIVPSTL